MNHNPFSLKDKNILITGASSGIGRQCAITCSRMGGNIILIGRNEERLKESINLLDEGNHVCFAQDIKETANLEILISQVVEKTGKISGFIHSAGVELTLPLSSMNSALYNDLFSVNVFSGFEFARIISKKKYLAETGANFVFIASIFGILGSPGNIAYCSSKGAVINGVKAMALELINKKIRVNSILPAFVKTKMIEDLFENIPEDKKTLIINSHPLGLGEPEDIANASVFLLSEASKWITGSNLIVDGGYSCQ